MIITMSDVVSSVADCMGHDGDNTMYVRFKNRETVYKYPGVSRDRYREILNSGAIGKILYHELRNVGVKTGFLVVNGSITV